MSYGPNGTGIRLCDWPPCHAQFDILKAWDGEEDINGWFGPSVFSFHMCPVHAPITFGRRNDPGLPMDTYRPHLPILNTAGSACSCGFVLTTASRPQAVSAAFYAAHLMDVCVEVGGSLFPVETPYACAVTDCAGCAKDNPGGVFSRPARRRTT